MNQKEQLAFDALKAENAELKSKIDIVSSENASAERISQLEADLASKSESYSKDIEAIKSKYEKSISDLKSEILEKDKVIDELSAANSNADSSDIITIGGNNYQSIAKKFHMDGKNVTIADLKKDTSLAQRALELKFLTENEAN